MIGLFTVFTPMLNIIDNIGSVDSRVILNICGGAGAGKSHTSLSIARGLVDKGSEVCVVDTENKAFTMRNHGNYSMDDMFKIIKYDPERGFSIKDMIECLRFLKSQKEIKVAVFDSFSSVYSDVGGMKDVVRKSSGSNLLQKWGVFEDDIRELTMLARTCGMHLILTTRASISYANKVRTVKYEQKEKFDYLYHTKVLIEDRKFNIIRDNTGCFRVDWNGFNIGCCIRSWCGDAAFDIQSIVSDKINELKTLVANDGVRLRKLEEWLGDKVYDGDLLCKLNELVNKERRVV